MSITERRCWNCKIIKPITEFYLSKKSGKGGYGDICKPCNTARTREWRAKYPIKVLDGLRRYRKTNRAKLNRMNNEWRRKNPDRVKFQGLKNAYGITKDEYLAMFQRQDGKCAICRVDLIKPFVDHDHATKRVRALLCRHCNTGLGHFRESPKLMLTAIQYLIDNSSQTHSHVAEFLAVALRAADRCRCDRRLNSESQAS